MKINEKLFSMLALVFGVLFSGAVAAQALTFDVTDAVASITAGIAVIATIGGAALLVSIAVRMWRRFRGAA